jgi:arabinosaccharide transport system substrate-binding protein
MNFPYGKAPLAILIVALVAGVGVWLSGQRAAARKPDLIFATFEKSHAAAYMAALPGFEKQHGVKVQIQVVDQRALENRLQSALLVGAEVPDVVELLDGTMGTFTKGPIEDIGFVDLTSRVHESGLYDRLVTSRFSKWSSRGRIFALPHDLHPVMLCYRRDLIEQLGIDVSALTTWEEFSRVGRKVVKDSTGKNGVVGHYMIDMQADGGDYIRILLLQRGGRMFDDAGVACFDNAITADVVWWYIHQLEGPGRIAFSAGWGQNLSRAMIDGLCLFYVCPDWRTMQISADIPSLNGKLALMPLPAWEPGGRRTTTWGGTGLALTKKCRNVDLAWELAKYLYYDPDQLGPRFKVTNIITPLKDAWNQPEFDEPRPFFSNMRIGQEYVKLAIDVPAEQVNAYQQQANGKLSEAFLNASLYYQAHGDEGLREFIDAELRRCADYVRQVMNRNVFLAKKGKS